VLLRRLRAVVGAADPFAGGARWFRQKNTWCS
jgi:hypothetical protein